MESISLWKGILIVMILGTASVGVPYAILRNVESLWGSYFYWIILTTAVMVLVWRETGDWRNME